MNTEAFALKVCCHAPMSAAPFEGEGLFSTLWSGCCEGPWWQEGWGKAGGGMSAFTPTKDLVKRKSYFKRCSFIMQTLENEKMHEIAVRCAFGGTHAGGIQSTRHLFQTLGWLFAAPLYIGVPTESERTRE
jgi:hypothetical protein